MPQQVEDFVKDPDYQKLSVADKRRFMDGLFAARTAGDQEISGLDPDSLATLKQGLYSRWDPYYDTEPQGSLGGMVKEALEVPGEVAIGGLQEIPHMAGHFGQWATEESGPMMQEGMPLIGPDGWAIEETKPTSPRLNRFFSELVKATEAQGSEQLVGKSLVDAWNLVYGPGFVGRQTALLKTPTGVKAAADATYAFLTAKALDQDTEIAALNALAAAIMKPIAKGKSEVAAPRAINRYLMAEKLFVRDPETGELLYNIGDIALRERLLAGGMTTDPKRMYALTRKAFNAREAEYQSLIANAPPGLSTDMIPWLDKTFTTKILALRKIGMNSQAEQLAGLAKAQVDWLKQIHNIPLNAPLPAVANVTPQQLLEMKKSLDIGIQAVYDSIDPADVSAKAVLRSLRDNYNKAMGEMIPNALPLGRRIHGLTDIEKQTKLLLDAQDVAKSATNIRIREAAGMGGGRFQLFAYPAELLKMGPQRARFWRWLYPVEGESFAGYAGIPRQIPAQAGAPYTPQPGTPGQLGGPAAQGQLPSGEMVQLPRLPETAGYLGEGRTFTGTPPVPPERTGFKQRSVVKSEDPLGLRNR